MISKSEIGAVILAGGKASRMGYRDKALQVLGDKPLLEHVLSKASPQVDRLILSLNHNIESYRQFSLPIVQDGSHSYAGPLLGILSALNWYHEERAKSGINYLACFPADVPDFPDSVVRQLSTALSRESADVAYITHSNQIQPLFSLWKLDLIEVIEKAVAGGMYGPKLVFGSLNAIAVDCVATSPAAFYNINRMEELKQAAQLLGE